jgi:hypothetical protein
MKKVFNSIDDVIHAYAQQPNDRSAEGRTGGGGNVFFDGVSLYSYGRHYELARYLDNDTVLINDRGYSNSTAKHINKAQHALSQYRRFYVTLCDPNEVAAQLRALKAKLMKARKPSKYVDKAFGIVEAHRMYMQWAETHPHAAIMPYTESLYRKEFEELTKFFESFTNSEEMQTALKAEREAEKRRKDIAGEDFRRAFYAFEPFEALRNAARLPYSLIRVNGEYIETSQNVKMPLALARTAYNLYKAGKLNIGDRIDAYSVKELTPEHVRIGCHLLNAKDLQEVME